MITLACAKCGATLTVDDGFAGGTCRCATCGTIQTVPAKDAATTSRVFGSACKPIFERAGDVAIASTVPRGPFERTDDEPKPRAARASCPPPTPGRRPKAWPAVVLVGVTGAVAVAMAVLLFKRLDRAATNATVLTEPLVTAATRRAPLALTDGPRFGPIRLKQTGPIVYLIDADATTAPFADGIRRMTLASIATLPSDRQTTIRFLTADDSAPRTAQAAAGDWSSFLNEWPAPQATDLRTSLKLTLADPVDEVVLLTARDAGADNSLADDVLALLSDRRITLHTVLLGKAADQGPLSKIASATGGESVALTADDVARLTAEAR